MDELDFRGWEIYNLAREQRKLDLWAEVQSIQGAETVRAFYRSLSPSDQQLLDEYISAFRNRMEKWMSGVAASLTEFADHLLALVQEFWSVIQKTLVEFVQEVTRAIWRLTAHPAFRLLLLQARRQKLFKTRWLVVRLTRHCSGWPKAPPVEFI